MDPISRARTANAAPSLSRPSLFFRERESSDAFKNGFDTLIVDAHTDRRRRLVRQLRMMGAAEMIEATATRGARAAGISGRGFDLAILRACPELEMSDLMNDLRQLGAQRVVMIASSRDTAPVIAAFSAGTVGYLVDRQASDPETGPSSSRAPAAPAVSIMTTEFDEEAEPLTSREIDILTLVADGKTNPEIGKTLSLSANTVKGHLARLSRKLHTGDRSRMVLLALRSGVIS